MITSRRRRRKKKVIYRTITFKLTARQKRSLWNYCKARKTTPTKLIKKMIRPYIENYDSKVPEELYVTETQLDMFEDFSE